MDVVLGVVLKALRMVTGIWYLQIGKSYLEEAEDTWLLLMERSLEYMVPARGFI